MDYEKKTTKENYVFMYYLRYDLDGGGTTTKLVKRLYTSATKESGNRRKAEGSNRRKSGRQLWVSWGLGGGHVQSVREEEAERERRKVRGKR